MNLGSTQLRESNAAVDLSFCSSAYSRNFHRVPSYVLEISAPDTNQSPTRVQLPFLDDKINNPILFGLEMHTNLQLILKVFETRTPTCQEEKLLAVGTVLLGESNHCPGTQWQSMIRQCSIPMLDHNSIKKLGCVNLTYLIVTPYPHLQTQHPSMSTENDSTMLVGHRGKFTV